MSIPNHVAAHLVIRLDFEPTTPSVTRAQFIQAIRVAVIEAHGTELIERVVAEEFLAALPTTEPRQ